MRAILRFAPVFDARMLDDPSLAREIMVQRGAFTTMTWDGEIPVVVDHDMDRVVGRVTHLRNDEYCYGGGDWWAAHAEITDPPAWLEKQRGVSWSCLSLTEQDVNGTRRILKGIHRLRDLRVARCAGKLGPRVDAIGSDAARRARPLSAIPRERRGGVARGVQATRPADQAEVSTLNRSGPRRIVETCGLGTHTFRERCETARGLRAGALIAVLGGLRAERRGHA